MKNGLLLGLLLIPAIAQAKTLDELLVEKGIVTKCEADAVSSTTPGKISWNDGTRFDFPRDGLSTTITTELHERYVFTDVDEDSGERNRSSFDTKIARVLVEGSVLDDEFSYVLRGNFVGTQDENGAASPFLDDAYIQWKGCECSSVTMGQFKTGFSRQFNSDDNTMQFADRSVISDFFTFDRNQGLGGTYKFADGKVQVGAAIFNGDSSGEGQNRPGVDTKHSGFLNLRVNPLGKMNPFVEGDIEQSEDLALSFGAAYAYAKAERGILSDDSSHPEILDATVDTSAIDIDANLKYRGASVHAEYFFSSADPDSGEKIKPSGFYVQGGYFVAPETEIAARYGFIDCDDGAAGGVCAEKDNVNEVTAGLNYYFMKHNLKAQVNYVFQNVDGSGADGDDVNTNKWVFQVSALM